MRSYDEHINTWQCTIETYTAQLIRCYPSEESRVSALRDAAAAALLAITTYKSLRESTEPVVGDGSEWFDVN